MPQNDIKLMHNFTTHLSRHALSHRGYEVGVSPCVRVCVQHVCCQPFLAVRKPMWRHVMRQEEAHLNSRPGTNLCKQHAEIR